MSTKVKICGITNLADAQAAVAAGADALGFNFYEKSPRHIPLGEAAEITRQLPSSILRVGVFVNASADFVLRAIRESGLTMLQFHGDEPPDFCSQFGLMSMKAFRVRGPETLKEIPQFHTDAYLLDAFSSVGKCRASHPSGPSLWCGCLQRRGKRAGQKRPRQSNGLHRCRPRGGSVKVWLLPLILLTQPQASKTKK